MNIEKIEQRLSLIASSLCLIGDAPSVAAIKQIQNIIGEIRVYKFLTTGEDRTATQVTEAQERLMNFLQYDVD